MFQNAIPNATYQIFFGGFNPTIGHFDFTQCVFRNLTLSTNGTSYAIFGSPGGGGIVSTMTSCLLYNLLGATAGNTNTIFGLTGASAFSLINSSIYIDASAALVPASLMYYGS